MVLPIQYIIYTLRHVQQQKNRLYVHVYKFCVLYKIFKGKPGILLLLSAFDSSTKCSFIQCRSLLLLLCESQMNKPSISWHYKQASNPPTLSYSTQKTSLPEPVIYLLSSKCNIMWQHPNQPTLPHTHSYNKQSVMSTTPSLAYTKQLTPLSLVVLLQLNQSCHLPLIFLKYNVFIMKLCKITEAYFFKLCPEFWGGFSLCCNGAQFCGNKLPHAPNYT